MNTPTPRLIDNKDGSYIDPTSISGSSRPRNHLYNIRRPGDGSGGGYVVADSHLRLHNDRPDRNYRSRHLCRANASLVFRPVRNLHRIRALPSSLLFSSSRDARKHLRR